MLDALSHLLPARVRDSARRWLGRFQPASPVVREWEWYARDHLKGRVSPDAPPLGDEWNQPHVIGMDVPAAEIVAHLDEVVFGPFLGHPELLLEIGAGGGRFTERLARRARRVVAADTSPTMIRLLRQRFGAAANVDTLLLDGTGHIAMPDDSVDAIVSYDVFVHLRHWDTWNYLAEFRRVLKVGGRAIVHHPNTLSELGWRKFLSDSEQVRKTGSPKAAFHVMTPELFGELARRAGLEPVRSETDVVRRDAITFLVRNR